MPRLTCTIPTWRSFAQAPDGFDALLHDGDLGLAGGGLRMAAMLYLDALVRAERDREAGRLYFMMEAVQRLHALACFCLTPPRGFRPATEEERWAALHEMATRNFLGDYQAAILRLGSMLYRLHRNRDGLAPEGRRAWEVLMACSSLPVPALQFLDDRLMEEGLWSLRPQLATHRSATRDLWLSMLQAGRTPDLVHTIWEITGAAEDADVKAALTGTVDGGR